MHPGSSKFALLLLLSERFLFDFITKRVGLERYGSFISRYIPHVLWKIQEICWSVETAIKNQSAGFRSYLKK